MTAAFDNDNYQRHNSDTNKKRRQDIHAYIDRFSDVGAPGFYAVELSIQDGVIQSYFTEFEPNSLIKTNDANFDTVKVLLDEGLHESLKAGWHGAVRISWVTQDCRPKIVYRQSHKWKSL